MPKRPPIHGARLWRPPPEADDVTRTQAQRIRSSTRWQRLRRWFLRRNPLCTDPFGHHATDHQVIAATQVHHIQPIATHPDLAFDPSNLQALCTACHSRSELHNGGHPKS